MANEKRLIDANALVKIAEKRCGVVNIKHIDDCPTVDAVEVVHGKWEEQKEYDFKARDYYLSGYTCSCCGLWYLNVKKYNYCPNCGAKMDGGKNNE